MDTEERAWWFLTFFEILTILAAAAIPIALAVYTVITTNQDSKEADHRREFDLKQAADIRQHDLYDKFLANMYKLYEDGHLDDDRDPWVFANAYHRAAHRQWDNTRKADVLQFLHEKELIGKTQIITERSSKQVSLNKISLKELNFDKVQLISHTKSLNQMNLKNVLFDQVSMINARFSFVDLDKSSFKQSRLNYAIFEDTSLNSVIFDRTQLEFTNFGNANLANATFINVNLSTARISSQQIAQAIFYNTILPNGTVTGSTTTTSNIFH